MTKFERFRIPTTAPAVVGLLVLVALFVFANPARADIYTVTNTSDSGPGSLRDAVNQATGTAAEDFIRFSLPAGSTIRLTTGHIPVITRPGGALSIEGPGAGNLTISASGSSIFSITGTGRAEISGLTISDGTAEFGGAIDNSVHLRLTGVRLANNTASFGGAINNSGTMYLANSTVSNNTVTGAQGLQGGGINNRPRGNLTVVDSTVRDNLASGSGFGGGIANEGTLAVVGSTLNGNTAGTGGGIFSTDENLTENVDSITNSTLTQNTATAGVGGGLDLRGGLANIEGSTITENTAPASNGGGVSSSPGSRAKVFSSILSGNTGGDVTGNTFASDGFNLVGNGSGTGAFVHVTDQVNVTEPLLGPLQDNGGPTHTRLPETTSPALDRGKAIAGVPTDQRGEARPLDFADVGPATGGDDSDIGAAELEPFPPSISIEEKSQTEGTAGESDMRFVVRLDRRTSRQVSVGYQTVANTAQPGDYTATSGILTFAPGETVKQVSVSLNPDDLDEPDERFVLRLSQAQNALLARSGAVGTILDDDADAIVSVSSSMLIEGDSGSQMESAFISLAGKSANTITVNYSTADGTAHSLDDEPTPKDYEAEFGTVVFAPGETMKKVDFPIYGDTLDEDDEYLTVTLDEVTGAPGVDRSGGRVSIRDDDGTPSAADDGTNASPLRLKEDGQRTLDVLANDSGLDDRPLTLAVESAPSMGTATITSDNKILYKPNPDRNGRDSFSYTVTDSDGESSTATVHLAVAKVNDGPPVARADRYSVAKGKTLRVAAPGVLKNDADPDGDALSATVLRKPGKGTLSLGGKGGFSYKAPANYTGKVTFAYRALDGMGGSDSATVTLYVKQPAG